MWDQQKPWCLSIDEGIVAAFSERVVPCLSLFVVFVSFGLMCLTSPERVPQRLIVEILFSCSVILNNGRALTLLPPLLIL